MKPKTVAESFTMGKYNITNHSELEINVCFMRNVTSDSFWQISNPFNLYLPAIAIQVSLMILTTCILMFILKPLRQPRFVAEMIAGIIIGSPITGNLQLSQIFTFEDNYVAEHFCGLGLTYYMFLMGLEMDVSALRQIRKRTLSISVVGILVPLIVGGGLYFVPLRGVGDGAGKLIPMGAMFSAISLSNSSFPDLARILSNVKLLHTDLGRLALTCAFISDISAWVFLVMTINFYDLRRFYMAAIPTSIFLLGCWFLLRPGIRWMINENKKKGRKCLNETQKSFILAAVAVCGCIADACGSHSMIGGFMLGFLIPQGEIAIDITESIQGFVNQIMLPMYFLLNGRRTNLLTLTYSTRWVNVLVVIIVASSSKVVSTLLVCLFHGMSLREALALGGLLNTKGVLSLIVLNEGRAMKAMDNTTFVVMGITTLVMSSTVAPIFFLVEKSTKRFSNYKQRTIETSNPNAELRILTCIHSIRNVSGIINLLQLSNATRRSPLCVFAVHLVQLTGTGRASAMLIVQDSRKTSPLIGNAKDTDDVTPQRAESDQIINAFGNFERTNQTAVTVHSLTAVSPYTTMHEDISHLAQDKHVAFILVPYHKLPRTDGRLHGYNISICEFNQKLLNNAPCSVGILVDRGVGTSVQCNSTDFDKSEFHIAMLFIGGPDDHEALSYATRMAEKPGVTLTVVRFLQAKEENTKNESNLEEMTESDEGKEMDDYFINEFRFKIMFEEHVSYQEKTVNNGDELMECVSSNYSDSDLYIVGRRDGVKSKLTRELSEWSDSPELGAIGETLITTQATEHASVLVVQQPAIGQLGSGPRRRKANYGKKKWASPVLNPDYEAYARRYNS